MDSSTVEENTSQQSLNQISLERPLNASSPQKLSKNQQKKLARKEKWIQQKSERRAREKQKRKLKIQEAKKNGKDLGPSRKLLKSLKMADSTCKLKVVFDLAFDNEMTEAEMAKAFKQLHRCYSINRRAEAPLQLYLAGYSELSKKQMAKFNGCQNWDVHFEENHYSELFDAKSVVYLTSDSPNVLDELDHNKAYIIGALVDHNRLKGLCFDQAVKKNVDHARLPLDLFFKLKTRQVLTIDQVYHIILKVTQGMTWQEAILDVIPKRKGVELKETAICDKIQNDSENSSDSQDFSENSNSGDVMS